MTSTASSPPAALRTLAVAAAADPAGARGSLRKKKSKKHKKEKKAKKEKAEFSNAPQGAAQLQLEEEIVDAQSYEEIQSTVRQDTDSAGPVPAAPSACCPQCLVRGAHV